MINKYFTFGALLILMLVGSVAAGYAGTLVQTPPGWRQVNDNGFGDPQAVEVTALEVFGGALYAGTANPIAGARIFRSADGLTWSPVTEPGFGIAHDIAPPAILDLAVFDGRLYATTGRGGNAGQIWRTLNGTSWAPMVITGFSNPDTVEITALIPFDGMLYAGATNRLTGAQIWRSYTGDNNSWVQVAPSAPGNGPAAVTGFAVFGGALYAAVQPQEAPAQVWRSFGSEWTTIVSDGFGPAAHGAPATTTGGMTDFGGYLYVGAGNQAQGAQLWRTRDETTWQQVITPGFGDPNNQKVEAVFVFRNELFASVKNAVTGLEVWRSGDGVQWDQVNQDGFGDSSNSGSNWSNATAVFFGRLHVATSNASTGGEVWRMQGGRSLFLPLLRR